MTYLAMFGRIVLLGFERVIVKKLGKSSSNLEATILFFGIGVLFLSPFLINIKVADWSFVKYAFLSSSVYAFGFVLYVRSLNEGDISLVTPVASFNVLFLFILSAIFLGENINVVKFLGIGLIFYGSSYLKPGANLLDSLRAVLKEAPCLYMLIYTFLLAIGRVIDKAGSKNVSPLLYSFTIYLLITLILLCYLTIKGNPKNVIHLFREKPLIATISGSINAFSYMFLLIALKGMEVSVAEPLTLLSTILAVVLGKFFFLEKIQQRLVAACIIFIGACFLLI